MTRVEIPTEKALGEVLEELASQLHGSRQALSAEDLTDALLAQLERAKAASQPLPRVFVESAARLIQGQAKALFETDPAVRRMALHIREIVYRWRHGRRPPVWTAQKQAVAWEPLARSALESGILDLSLERTDVHPLPVRLRIPLATFLQPPAPPWWLAGRPLSRGKHPGSTRRRSLPEVLLAADQIAASVQQMVAELRALNRSLRAVLSLKPVP